MRETAVAPATQQQSETKKARSERPKPQRPARRREHRDPMRDFAFQPYYGGFGGYRRW
jgi:hypothetical protein